MAKKVFISSYTHRTEQAQLDAIYKDSPDLESAPIYRPSDLPIMFRSTRRVEIDTYYVSSIANIAPDKKLLKEFLDGCKKRGAYICSIEEKMLYRPVNFKHVPSAWTLARIKGAAKAGGDKTAAQNKADIAERTKGMTKKEWTDGSIKNAQLVKKYGSCINALKNIAHEKGWGKNRQDAICIAKAAEKRAKRRQEAGRV